VIAGHPSLRTPAACVEGAVRRHRRVPDWIARKPPDPELHDGAGARAGDQHHCLPGVVELADSDTVLVQSATPGVADRVATAFPRASAIDRLERVTVGHLAPSEGPRAALVVDERRRARRTRALALRSSGRGEPRATAPSRASACWAVSRSPSAIRSSPIVRGGCARPRRWSRSSRWRPTVACTASASPSCCGPTAPPTRPRTTSTRRSMPPAARSTPPAATARPR
jgi:hypothetical protein